MAKGKGKGKGKKSKASAANCKRITFHNEQGKAITVTRCRSHEGGLKKAAKARFSRMKRARKVCIAGKAPDRTKAHSGLRPFVKCK